MQAEDGRGGQAGQHHGGQMDRAQSCQVRQGPGQLQVVGQGQGGQAGQARPLGPGAVLQHGAGAVLAGARQQTQGHPTRAPETPQGRVQDGQHEVPAILVHEAGPLRPCAGRDHGAQQGEEGQARAQGAQ